MQIIFILRFRNKTLLMIYSLYIAHKYTHASLQLNIVLSPGGIDNIICIFYVLTNKFVCNFLMPRTISLLVYKLREYKDKDYHLDNYFIV